MNKPRIEVVGTGLVCCLGAGVDQVFSRMCRGDCGIRAIERFSVDGLDPKRGGQLPDGLEDRLRNEVDSGDLTESMVKTAGAEALKQAGIRHLDSRRFGLVLATNFGPMEMLEWCWRERLDLGTMDGGTFAVWEQFAASAAEFFECRGPVAQISLSCASGAAAVALAQGWLRQDRADYVLAVGYDMLTEFCWTGLANLHTITTDEIRPFDRRRAGTIFSEGAAAMLFSKTGDDAGGALACLAGTATNNNAFHMTAPPKEAEGSRRVMSAALDDAALSPADIDHICAHATGTTANDATEAAAFRNLFGEHLNGMTVGAHKSQLGHMLGAAGLAEAVITVQSMRTGVIPPTVNSEEPDPECVLVGVVGSARQCTLRSAITNSAGIGGNNASLVFTAQ